MNLDHRVKFMDWDKLKYFYFIAKIGSFKQAAGHLNLSQPALSRCIQSLEKSLNASLFQRIPRHKLVLTPQGQILFEVAEKVMSDVLYSLNRIQEEEGEPQGKLRISTTGGFASTYLVKHLPGYIKQFPKVKLSIFGTDDDPYLNFHKADVIIRPAPATLPPNIIQQHLLTLHVKLYASQEYLAEFGTPKLPSDLENHRLIGFGDQTANPFPELNWHLVMGLPEGQVREAYLYVNFPQSRLELARKNLGIISIASEHQGVSDLVEVLPEHPGAKIDFYYFYTKDLRDSIKIQSFYNYLCDSLAKGTNL